MATGPLDPEMLSPLVGVLWARVRREMRRQARLAQQPLPEDVPAARELLEAGLGAALAAQEPARAVQELLAEALKRAARALGVEQLGQPGVILIGPAITGGQLAELRRALLATLAVRRGAEVLVLADREIGAAALLALGLSEELAVFEAEDLLENGAASNERPVARIEWVRFEAGQLPVKSGLGLLPAGVMEAEVQLQAGSALHRGNAAAGTQTANAPKLPALPNSASATSSSRLASTKASEKTFPAANADKLAAPSNAGKAAQVQNSAHNAATASSAAERVGTALPGGNRLPSGNTSASAASAALGTPRRGPTPPNAAALSSGRPSNERPSPQWGGFVIRGASRFETRGERCGAEAADGSGGMAELLRFHPPSGDRAGALAAWRAQGERLLAIDSAGLASNLAAGIGPDGGPWLVRAQPTGRDLREFLAASGPLRGPALTQLALSLARSLGQAHQAGLTHGDLRAEWVEHREASSKRASSGPTGRFAGAARKGAASGPNSPLGSEPTSGASDDDHALPWRLHELGLAALVGLAELPLVPRPAGLDLPRPRPMAWPRPVVGFAAWGVPEYAAPELAVAALAGGPAPDPRAVDCFALGLLLFEAASGRLPLAGYPSGTELLEARAEGRGERAQDLPGLAPALGRAIDGLLEPRPERRATDLLAWADDLQHELQRNQRGRLLRQAALACGIAGLALGALTLNQRGSQARESLPALELVLSPARTSQRLAAESLPSSVARARSLGLVDANGQRLSGWRLEREADGGLLLRGPWSWPSGIEQHQARLSIDGRIHDQPPLALAFIGGEAWDLEAPRLSNSLGQSRPAERIFADELNQWSLQLPLSGASDWVSGLVLRAGSQGLEWGPSERARGVPLALLLEQLKLPNSGAIALEAEATDRGGARRSQSIRLEIEARPSPPPEQLPSLASATQQVPESSRDKATKSVSESTASLSTAAPAVLPKPPGELNAASAGDGSAVREAGPAPAAEPGAIPAAHAESVTKAENADGLLAEQATSGNGPAAAALPLAQSGQTPTPTTHQSPPPSSWKLALDGLAENEVLGPVSRPRLLLGLELQGPTQASALELQLGRAGVEQPLGSRRIEASKWRRLENGAWRAELALPAPWRAEGLPPEADGDYQLSLWLPASGERAAEQLLLRRFQVAVHGPRVEWALPSGGLLAPGPDGSLLLGLYVSDPNGLASLSGELLLENGQRRPLEFLPDAAPGSARLRLEPADSALLARLSVHASDSAGADNAVEFGPLRVGMVPGFEPARVLNVPQVRAPGGPWLSQPRPSAPMRKLGANAAPYLFGGRGDALENELFREANLPAFQPDERQGLPRAWAIELPPGTLPAFLLDEREVSAAEFLAFVDASDGWQEPRWWPAGATPGNAARRHALGAQLAAGAPDLPATGMNWEEAAAYAAWCGKRLPTWAEFEYALRGGTRYRPYASYEEALGLPAAELPERLFAGFAAAPQAPRAVEQGADRCPDSGHLGLSGNVAEWTATPVWFDLPISGRPPTPRQAILERLPAFLDPSWALVHPEPREFWVAGGRFDGRDFDFSAATSLPRQRGEPGIGMRCALSMQTYLERFSARLAEPAAPADR